ncbi:MAG TPA: hypothetical protein VM327_01875 [Candidatus Thermoplasmatota archaeon]|nr:hypothetical protein [Candidatus Thermoplasmatota archaeon]
MPPVFCRAAQGPFHSLRGPTSAVGIGVRVAFLDWALHGLL